ncbi:hypothetical protein Dimus_029213 [Dionaea muscipula]
MDIQANLKTKKKNRGYLKPARWISRRKKIRGSPARSGKQENQEKKNKKIQAFSQIWKKFIPLNRQAENSRSPRNQNIAPMEQVDLVVEKEKEKVIGESIRTKSICHRQRSDSEFRTKSG